MSCSSLLYVLAMSIGVFCSMVLPPSHLWAVEQERIVAAVPWGAYLREEQATRLAWSSAWLQGLKDTETTLLQNNTTVRLTGLDEVERLAVSALVGGPPVQIRLMDDDKTTLPSPTGTAVAWLLPATPSSKDIALELNKVWHRQQYEETIVGLSRVVPAALALATDLHNPGASGQDPYLRQTEANRLLTLIEQTEGYVAYLTLLRNSTGSRHLPERLQEIEAALALAPYALPLKLARAEILLQLDRPSAVLQELQHLELPNPQDAGVDPWYAAAKGSVFISPEAAFAADARLYARSLGLRALARLSLGHSALAESDLNAALALTPQKPELWLARGAARQLGHQMDGMCEDYRQACLLGMCNGLYAARQHGYCQPGTP